FSLLFIHRSVALRYLHSFPTRRSSDLVLSIVVLLPMVFVHSTGEFSILRVLLALLAGGTLTLALSAAHPVIPGEYRGTGFAMLRSEEHTSELQSLRHLVCRLLLEKKNH